MHADTVHVEAESFKTSVNREITTLDHVLNRYTRGDKPKKGGILCCDRLKRVGKYFPTCSSLSEISAYVPILEWLPRYQWKEWIVPDFVAGLSSGVMQIPLGLGFASLAGLPPSYGLLSGLFPALVYMFFGTCRHLAIGAFPVVYIMIGDVIDKFNNKFSGDISVANLSTVDVDGEVAISAMLALMAGVFQLTLRAVSFGNLMTLLSDAMIGGFSTGAAIHVVISQIKYIFGVPNKNVPGVAGKLQVLYNLYKSIPKINYCAVIMSAISFVYLLINMYIIRPNLSKVTKFPFPGELILVVIMTSVSYAMNLHTNYGLHVIGFIQTGLPWPQVPPMKMISEFIIDGFIIAVVAYVISYSFAKTYGRHGHYKVDANQEMLAMGISNIFSSFFQCGPVCDVPARSLNVMAVGGRSQLSSVSCCGFLVMVVLYMAPLFQPLPYSVVAVIVIVCLKGLLVQLLGVKQIWDQNKLDGVVFVVSCVSVILLDIELGLLVGVIASLLSIVYRSVKPYTCTLSPVEASIYLDNHYFKDMCPSDIKLFRYFGMINFSTYNHFRRTLYDNIAFDPDEWKRNRRKTKCLPGGCNRTSGVEEEWKENDVKLPLKVVIIDLSCVPSVDVNGLVTMKEIYEELQELDVHVLFSGVHGHLIYTLEKMESRLPGTNHFPSVEDAFSLALSLASVGENTRF